MTCAARLIGLVVWFLKELSGQAAYERHLIRHGRKSSPAEWKHFIEEAQAARYSRPRCC